MRTGGLALSKVSACVFILHQTKTEICQISREVKSKREIDSQLRTRVRGRAGVTSRLRISLRRERPMSLSLIYWEAGVTQKDSFSGFDQKSYPGPDKPFPTNV